MKYRLICVLSTLFILLNFSNAYAKYDPDLNWYTIETQHFIYHYHDGLENVVDDFIDKGKRVHSEITQYFNWVPRKKTHVILSDHWDFPNGIAQPWPINKIELYMTPPSEIEGLEDFEDWKYLLFKHEYTHIVHLDMANDFPLDMRNILGRHYLLFPNTFLPKWIIEGIATYIETDKQLGVGRGQSSYYRALMRNEVKNGINPLSRTNQAQLDWPAGTSRYLYGVYFFSFLEQKYGTYFIQEFMDAYSQFPLPYFINTVFKSVYKKSLHELWAEFQNHLKEEFKNAPSANLARAESRQISFSGFNSGFSQLQPNGNILFIKNNHHDIKTLVSYNPTNQSYKTLFTSNAISTSFDIHATRGVLIPLVEWVNNTRLVTDLYILDLKTNKKTRLTHEQRYVRATWHPSESKIVAVKNQSGQHQLDLLDGHGKLLKTIWKFEKDFIIGNVDYSPNGKKIIASVFRLKSGWNIEEFDIDNQKWKTITKNHYIESQVKYSDSGNEIIYTADYTGIYNIYQLSLESNSLYQMSQVNSAALFPTIDKKQENLYYAKLTSNGFNLHLSKQKYPLKLMSTQLIEKEKATLGLPQLHITDVRSEELKVQDYNGLKYLTPTWWLPLALLNTDGNQLALGFITTNRDPIEHHLYSLLFAYDINNKSPIWNVNYRYLRFTPSITISNQRQNFYQVANNSQVLLRQEQSSDITINWPFRKINNNWNIFATFKRVNNRIYFQKNRNKALDSNIDNLINVGVSHRTITSQPLAVSQHSGSMISLNYELNRLTKTVKPNSRIILDTAIYSPVYFRSVGQLGATFIASGSGARKLFLGDYSNSLPGNNSAGKRTYNFRGYSNSSFSGSNLQIIHANLFIPVFYPQRSLMLPPIGVSTIKLNPFFKAARIASFNEINSAAWYKSIGAELKTQANFGYGRFPYTITAGLSKGLDEGGEFNQYFSIVAQFN